MSLSSDFELKRKFRNLYPEYVARLDGVSSQDFNSVHEQLYWCRIIRYFEIFLHSGRYICIQAKILAFVFKIV